MSIYIKNMDIPADNPARVVINPNGQVFVDHSTWYSEYEAVQVPPHGDLIDRDEFYEKTADWEAQALHMVEVHANDEDNTEWRKWSTVLTERSAFKFDVQDAPTVIPAESEGE